MSVIDDVRSALQDFLAPQLRELSARMEALKKVINAKFEDQDAKLDSISKQIQGINEKLDLDRRLTKLESQQVSIAAKSA